MFENEPGNNVHWSVQTLRPKYFRDTPLAKKLGVAAGILLGVGYTIAGIVNIDQGETTAGAGGAAVGLGIMAVSVWARQQD